jgi:hypothetical protein
MRFLIGGGNDPERLYHGLQVVGEKLSLRATGDRSETLRGGRLGPFTLDG